MKRSLYFALLSLIGFGSMASAQDYRTAPVEEIIFSHDPGDKTGHKSFEMKLQVDGRVWLQSFKQQSSPSNRSSFPRPTGLLYGHISLARFQSLANAVRKSGIATIKSTYPQGMTKKSRTSIGTVRAGVRSTIFTEGETAPAEFVALAQILQAQKGAIQWKRPPAPKTSQLSVEDFALQHCEKHPDAPLQIGKAAILYGRRNEMGAYGSARRIAFPHTRSHVFGGCVVSPD